LPSWIFLFPTNNKDTLQHRSGLFKEYSYQDCFQYFREENERIKANNNSKRQPTVEKKKSYMTKIGEWMAISIIHAIN